ncbi:MAG: hypothetical protein H0T15_00840 [Thermoleophilaceae bacterium]|nr:hypothetical protein [Thermoleophilaceae bacterium]
MRLAVIGKGGAGKSVVSATLARVLARRGQQVLALDSDSLPGMSFSLGAASAKPLPNEAVERDEEGRFHFADGLDAAGTAQRYAIEAPDGVRLLQVAKAGRAGPAAVEGSVNAFFMIVQELEYAPQFDDWTIVGDLPAGGRQAALGWVSYVGHFLLIVEPTMQAMLTARRVRRIATQARPGAGLSLVVNKATGAADAERVEAFLDMPALAVVPMDEGVRRAERAGVSVLDHDPDSPAVEAITRLAERLEAQTAPHVIPEGPRPPAPCGCGAPARPRETVR